MVPSPARGRLFIALVHYPVYNKYGDVVTTAITNLDLHDLGRLSVTFDISACYIVNPSPGQKSMALRLQNYWLGGIGAGFNESRRKAFERLVILDSVEDIPVHLQQKFAINRVSLVGTTARPTPNALPPVEIRHRLEAGEAILLLFGTGSGMTESVMERCDFILAPISGRGDYNHLSVRCATAIILDRVLNSC